MTYEQFNRALNYANAIRLIVKEKLKQAGWQDFEIILSFGVDIDDNEENSGGYGFIYTCDVNGSTENISYRIHEFITDYFPLRMTKVADYIKDYFVIKFCTKESN